MTRPTTACADGTAADPGELRDNLRRADPGVLVAVLAQLTGDASVVDTFGPKISHIPDPPERAGVTDPATAEFLIDAVIAALGAQRPADDSALFRRLLPVALGCEVDDEFVPLLLEQGGFRLSEPTLPRTVPIPDTTDVAIAGAGPAGIIAAPGGADGGGG